MSEVTVLSSARQRGTMPLRGRSYMAFALTPEPPIADWLGELDAWLRGASGFFAGRPVVLDLSATPALDHGAAAALQLLGGLLNDSHSSLRLVLPAAQARVAFISDSAGKAVAPDTVHISARAAILAAYASLPGAAFVTPALCRLLAQPPEFLALPAQSPPP